MSSKDRIWREGDDRWTWTEGESVPRYMWSQIPQKDVVDILNRSHELQAQVDALETALVDNWCYENEELDTLLNKIAAIKGDK